MYFLPLFQNSENTAHAKHYLPKYIFKCTFSLKGGKTSSWKGDSYSGFKNKVAVRKSRKKYIS